METQIFDCSHGCPVQSTLQFISGKWKSVILYHLIIDDQLRFSEIQKKMDYVSKRMLARQLYELEEDNIIQKTVFPTVPVQTEYTMTEFGRTLTPVIMAMVAWGDTYNGTHGGQSKSVSG